MHRADWVTVAAVISLALAAGSTTSCVPGSTGTLAAGAASGKDCGQGSWTAGTTDLCDGELVYRDYVYDDHGASLAGLPDDRAEGLYAALRIPNDAFGDLQPAGMAELFGITGDRTNTADLVALRVRLEEGLLEVTAELNTMFAPDDAVVVIGLDTDNDPSTAAGPTWPAGLIANPFELLPTDRRLANHGLDEFIVMTNGDTDTNTYQAVILQPPGDAWRIQAVVARHLPTFPAGPVVMNVAFRGVDERGHWWENAQAKALAVNDISAMGTVVSVAELRDGATRQELTPRGLVRQRVYISEFPVGEGVRAPDGVFAKPNQFTGAIDFLGKYQPYGIVVPDTHGPHGIQFVLHGLGENHSALLADPAGMQNPPPIAEQMGIPYDRIILVPLGRGPSGFYAGPAERDFLDVLADVRATFPVDAARIFGGGMSMGGYGALRMLALHPDIFAATVTWVAFTGDPFNGTPFAGGGLLTGALGNIVELLGNIRNVPLATSYAALDELVHVNEAWAIRDRLAELELESAFWLHYGATHSTLAAIQDYAKEAAWTEGRTRATDPARVSYRTDLEIFDADLELAPDGAWWVDDIVPAGPGPADVDAVSHGCGIGDPVTELTTSFGVGPVVLVWDGQFIDVAGSTDRSPANHLELDLVNVSSLSIDVGDPAAPAGSRQACLTTEAVSCHVTTDVRTTITLTDGRSLDLLPGEHDCLFPAVATATSKRSR